MSFLEEVRRRKAFQVGAVYAVVAWLLVQVVATVEAPLNLPDWVDTLVIVLLAIGFPVTLIFTWAFNVTSEGVVRDTGRPGQSTGRRIEYVLIGLMAVAIVWLVYRDVSRPTPPATASAPLQAAAEAAEPPSARPNSIAVLPFENLSEDPDNAAFSAGIHESITSQLARINDLSVTARTSVMRYEDVTRPMPEIAAELNVETLMEGSVQYADGRVLVTAQLIDGETDAHLWSDQYEAALDDYFGIQGEIARDVASQVGVTLSAAEVERIERPATNSALAAELYLRALSRSRSVNNVTASPEAREALQLELDRALEADPDFADVYALKAWTYANSMLNDQLFETMTQAEAERRNNRLFELVQRNAREALRLDRGLGLAHGALALGFDFLGRLEEGAAAWARAFELSPENTLIISRYLDNLWAHGRIQAAVLYAERQVEIDPNGADGHGQLAVAYHFAGRYKEAVAAGDRSLELDPSDAVTHWFSILPRLALGNRAEALEAARATLEVLPEAGRAVSGPLGYAMRLLGEADEAESLVQRSLQGSSPSTSLPSLRVVTLLAADDYERAFDELSEHAARSGRTASFIEICLRENAWSDPVLNEPEWVELRESLSRD